MNRIVLPERPRILVVALRRLGDVLLTTPLIASLRKAWPDATIEALVFADTAGILAGNPDLDGIVTMPPRRPFTQSLSLMAKLWRRYDLAISTQSGDRPVFFAFVAGSIRMAPVEARAFPGEVETGSPSGNATKQESRHVHRFQETVNVFRANGTFKRFLLHKSVPVVAGVHRVEDMLRLADALGIERVPRLVPPAALPFEGKPSGDYAVIHAAPMFRYKQWTVEGWRDIAASLKARGVTVIATGGPAAEERAYLDEIWRGAEVTRLDGKLNWGQLSGLLAAAKVFIGPDTSVTHLAAACGCATVALFGPTDPRLWGPWPVGGLSALWADTGAVQQRGNVWLVQHTFPCTPCQFEGCERKLASYSACLDALTPQQVMVAIDEALGSRR